MEERDIKNIKNYKNMKSTRTNLAENKMIDKEASAPNKEIGS